MDSSRIWYAAYGSNLALERFNCYIRGGTPTGGSRAYPGCRLQQAPIDSRRWLLPVPLYFAHRATKSWDGGGVAFVGHRPDSQRPSKGRVFLLEHQQFEDVVAQENNQAPGDISVSTEDAATAGYQDVRETGWYRRVLHLGELDGSPVLTCTAATDIGQVEPVTPAPSYLRWLCRGLRETWDCSPAEITSYLVTVPGMAEYQPIENLQILVDELLAQ